MDREHDAVITTKAIAPPIARGPADLRPTGMPDRIYGALLGQILDGVYPQGSRLPTEHQLAESFQTSRPTVREALARLRADGIIQTRHGSGTTVAHRPDPDVRRFAPLETLSDIRRCFDFRMVAEAGAAALAATDAGDREREAIHDANQALQKVIETGGIGAEEDYAFHRAIAHASMNPYFVTVLGFLQEQVLFSMNLSRNLSLIKTAARRREVQAEHADIVAAIDARDASAASAAMRRHLEQAVIRMFGT
jgi:DNA-binding FadR family transcriptional regulator